MKNFFILSILFIQANFLALFLCIGSHVHRNA